MKERLQLNQEEKNLLSVGKNTLDPKIYLKVINSYLERSKENQIECSLAEARNIVDCYLIQALHAEVLRLKGESAFHKTQWKEAERDLENKLLTEAEES